MARKEAEKRPDWEASNVGLVLFTALMIILLAFFIMLSSMAVIDEQRQLQAYGSLIGAFGILPGGLSPYSSTGSHITVPAAPMEIIKQDLELIKDVLARQLIENKIQVLIGRDRYIISLEGALLFPPDDVDILPEMENQLLEIADIIKGEKYRVIIEAHTDDQPPLTEEFTDNWEISALRAAAVFRFLVERGGVEADRLEAYGYAGNSPRVPNNSPRNRARNNRIDLILHENMRDAARRAEAGRNEPSIFNFKGFDFNLFRGED